jgi:hypothetical protein
MHGEKTTCLSQHKATPMLFRSCSLETSGLPINSSIFYSKQTSGTNMQSRQTKTTKNNTPIKKRLKRGQGLVLRSRTQETLRAELPRDLDYHKQELAMCLVYFN